MRGMPVVDWSRYLRPSETPLPNDPAEPVPIVSPGQLSAELELLYQTGLTSGDSTGWIGLDRFFTVKRGQFTLITGTPGSGKSALADNLMMNLARMEDWKWAVFSAENYPYERYLATLAEIWTGKPFNRGPNLRMSRTELSEAVDFIDEHFALIPPADGVTPEFLLAATDDLVAGRGLDGLLIDPWNYVEHRRPPHRTAEEYLSEALTRISAFARSRKIHVFIVAHPKQMSKEANGSYPVVKMYDVSGGAQWWNKSDNALSVWRDYVNPSVPTQVYVHKIRFREIGKIGQAELHYDTLSGRFVEPSAQSGRDEPSAKGTRRRQAGARQTPKAGREAC